MSGVTFGKHQTCPDVALDSMDALPASRPILDRLRSVIVLLLVLSVVLAMNGPFATVIEVTHTGDSGAGSLRDAINQANANPGPDTIEFNIPEEDPGFNGLWWTITIASALPALTDDGTQISGFSQSARRGDTNDGSVGTGGEVGVDRVALNTFRRPEVAIRAAGFDALTIDGGASDVIIEGLAIYGAESGIVARGFEPGPDRTSAGSNRRIVELLIGVAPDGSDPDTERISRYGIVVWPSAEGADPTNLTVERCYVGFNGQDGIMGIKGATTLRVVLSEVFANGWAGNNHDGIDVNGVEGEITANLSRNNTNSVGTPEAGSGAGIEAGSSFDGGGGNIIENNTVVDNLGAGIAIRAGSSGNVVRRNVSTRNAAGIVVSEENGPATNRNLISENSTFDNEGLGIDLHAGNNDGLTDGVTLNSPSPNGSGSNGLQPYPVITRAVALDGEIIVSGFASEGASIEFFFADDEQEAFGEGRGHLVTFLESSEDDEDPGSGTYGPQLNGSGTVSTDLITAPSFAFRTSFSGIDDRLDGARITATESVGDNTSEFGPTVRLLRLPDRVTLSGPADEVHVDETPIVFSWEPSGGADTYEIQFSKTPGFLAVSDSAVGLTRPEYPYDRIQPGIPCYWRVRGVADDGPGRWSDVWSFTFTVGTAPEQVVLMSPGPGIAGVPTEATFEWEPADGGELYELQISTSVPVDQGPFANPIVSIETDQTSYPVAGLEVDRMYYWQVRGKNGSRSGPWSNVWSFSTGDMRPPPFVLLLSPVDGAVDVDPNTLFEWLSWDDAVSFVIEVTTDPPDGDGAFDTPDIHQNLDGYSFVTGLMSDTGSD